MSLVVWLPLTKDLRQQGLSNVTVTNNGATFNSAGKLGGCYSFDGSNDNFSYIPNVDGLETFSIALWLCPTASTPVGAFFSLERDTYWQLTFNGTNIGIRDNSIGWNGTRKNYSSGTYTANVWTHLVVTYNKGILKIYRDGNLLSTNTVGGTKLNTGINNARIGSAVQNGYYYAGKINDVRFYDHCLSPLEVKQISQGLVLHYPLNRNGWGQENLLKNSHIKLDNNGYYVGTYSFANSEEIVAGETYTLSFNGELQDDSQTGWYFNIFPSPYTAIINKSTDKEGRFAFSFIMPKNDGKHTAIGCYSTPIGNRLGCAIWNVKLEKGSIATPWCPNSSDTLATTMGLNSTIEYDCSGFCNNGTRNGTFDWTSNTPKYSVSQIFNGSNNAIQTPSLPTMITDKNYTIACWVYKTSIGTKGYQTIYGGPSGYELEARNGASGGAAFVGWNWGKPLAEYEFNKWNHFCFVHSDNDCKIYLNGEYISSGTAKASNPTGNYFIGAWNTATQQNYEGLMSDFRIYATALSASDVKSLYQNCATIDSDGTIRGQIRS